MEYLRLNKLRLNEKIQPFLHCISSFEEVLFFKLGFTPCKAEQPLWGMELQEKEAQKD